MAQKMARKPKAPAPGRPHADIDAASVPLPPADGFEAGGMFVFDARPVIRNWPAKVKVPVGGGEFVVHEVRFDLDYLDFDGLRELHEDLAGYQAEGGVNGAAGDPLMPLVRGWSGIARQGAGNQAAAALVYGEASKALLLRDGKVRAAVIEAYARMVMGIDEKNSSTSPAAGQPQPGPNRAERRRAGKALEKALKKGTA